MKVTFSADNGNVRVVYGEGEWPSFEVSEADDELSRRCARKVAEQCGPGESVGEAYESAFTHAMLGMMQPDGELAERLRDAMSDVIGFAWLCEPWREE